MSDIRYINLQTTPDKWKNTYFGDFEAPLALYPLPVPNYYEVQECAGAGLGYIKTFDILPINSSVLIDNICWEVFSSATTEPTLLEFTSTYVDCATCQSLQPTPTPTVTPSLTPSITPSITPTSTPIPITPSVTPTNTVTPSVTPTLTPTITQTNTPTPSVTPTFTPTPSSTPQPQFFILAENTDEITTETDVNLITQDGDSDAYLNMVGFAQGVLIEVDDAGTSVLRSEVTQDAETAFREYPSSVNLEFSWTHMVATDDLYQINIYERDDIGGGSGRLLESSSRSNNGTYTYTGKTSVIATATKHTSNDAVLNVTSGAGTFTYLGQTFSYSSGGQQQWGIDGNGVPWGSNQYNSGVIQPSQPSQSTYKFVFVRTSLTAWTRYTYVFDTQSWINPQTIGTGTTNYGTSDQSTLVDNL